MRSALVLSALLAACAAPCPEGTTERDGACIADGGRTDGGAGGDAPPGDDAPGLDAVTLDVGQDAAPDPDVATLADAPPGEGTWSDPVSLVDDFARLAMGERVHVVGHLAGELVHRSSADDGATWSAPTVIAPGAGNFPGMYGGLAAQGAEVFLLTGDGDMSSGPRQLDVRRSSDHGATWSAPVRITSPAQPIFRARLVVRGALVHVVGTASPTTSAAVVYFRSTDGGRTFAPGRELATALGPYGGGQTVAVDGSTVHVGYTLAMGGVGAGPALYIRSSDDGLTWSAPIDVGEPGGREARVQIVAVDGHVLACWQREAAMTGLPIPADRLGFNHSADGGLTWDGARALPYDTGVDRNHQQIWMSAGGDVHLVYRTGDGTADPTGHLRSRDYGATWDLPRVAIDTGEINHPYSVTADADAVHVVSGPLGRMLYARRPLR